ESQRAILWSIFEKVIQKLATGNLVTYSGFFALVSASLAESKNVIFDHIIVDEAQDLGIAHLRFFAILGGMRPNALFFASDLGQRIFQQPFSWRALGIDVRGRSRTLRVNYRTSHQIRTQSDRLLSREISDVDGNRETRDSISVFNGEQPIIAICRNQNHEIQV